MDLFQTHFSKVPHYAQQLEENTSIVRFIITLNNEKYTETSALETTTANIQLRYRVRQITLICV